MSDTGTKDPFGNIRPYNNSEAPAVLARLAADAELAAALATLRLPRLSRWVPWLAQRIITLWLTRQVKSIESIEDLQIFIKPHLERVIAETSTFTMDGLQHLSRSESFLLVSNHRDIAMDPAYCNYALHRAGHQTLRIAIGSNLLSKPWVADLMRLNKSFVVRRDVTGPRELLAASKQLAGYIRETITRNDGPVWIAQREGRAKNGLDSTEPAVIKMLSLSRDKQHESVGETLASLSIVPVAISYELDPCDLRKAQELAAGESYQKQQFEDVASIGLGISGYKGCVHLEFGEPIADSQLGIDHVVAQIDKQIGRCFALFPTHAWAWEMQTGRSLPEGLSIRRGMVDRVTFERRIGACPETLRGHLIAMYANPVKVALAHQGQPAFA